MDAREKTAHNPTGSRTGLPFAEIYEMSKSKQMEWTRGVAPQPFYFHTKNCSRIQGVHCGHDCAGTWGEHVAQDASEIRAWGWKPADSIPQPETRYRLVLSHHDWPRPTRTKWQSSPDFTMALAKAEARGVTAVVESQNAQGLAQMPAPKDSDS